MLKTLLAAVVFAAPALSAPALAEDLLPVLPTLADPATLPALTAPATPVAISGLRSLPAPAGGWRLEGETAALTFRVHLTPSEATAGGALVLGLESAVSVMPEASRLALVVNGHQAGAIRLEPRGDGRPVELPLAAGHLVAGWNEITLAAAQRHRVDCSVNGTYELWTVIDPQRSGLRLPGEMADKTIPDIAGLRRDSTGALPVRLNVVGDDLGAAAGAVRAAGAVARLADAERLVATVGPGDETVGIEILVGKIDQLVAAGYQIEADRARLAGGIAVVEGARPRLVVAGRSAAEIDEAVTGLAGAAEIRSWPDAPQRFTLAELGLPSESFSGRFWQRAFTLALPPDALLADYDSVALSLDAAYAPRLDRTAHMSIHVNGGLAATLPLSRRAGEILDDREIELPLSLFQPGHNRVELKAELTAPEDAECDPRLQISGKPRLMMLETSTVTVPRLARMGRIPDLAATLGMGQAGLGAGDPITITLPRRNRESLAVAAMLFARMAMAADRLPALTLLDGEPAPDRRDAIVIGQMLDLSGELMARAGLDPAELGGAWGTRLSFAPLVAPGFSDVIVTGSLKTGLSATDIGALLPTAPPPMLDEWRGMFDEPGEGLTDRLGTVLGDLFGDFGFSFHQATAEYRLPVSPGSRLVIAQAHDTSSGGAITVVTAATAADLLEGTAQFTRPDLWRSLTGRAVVLDGRTETVAAIAPRSTALVATRSFDLVNLRLTTAAWFAGNVMGYALMLIASALLLGAATFALLRRSGAGASR